MTATAPARISASSLSGRRFAIAALVSLVVPGAGQVLLGRHRAAVWFGLPVALLAVVFVGAWVYGGATDFLAFLVSPGVLPAVAVLNVALAAWRVAASMDAARRSTRQALALTLLAPAIMLLVVAPHAWLGSAIAATSDFLDSAFASARGPGLTDRLPELGVEVPWQRPGAVPWGDDGRFDLLLLGSDAGPDRWSRRMDTMLLVEVDVASGRASMIGIPRNLQNAPLPPGPARDAASCGCFRSLLNDLYVEATFVHPGRWPGTGAAKGIGAVRSVVSELTGRPIDAVLVADLRGVIEVVDAMGGLHIDVPNSVYDASYPDPVHGRMELYIPAGEQRLDGRTALAYARSRHQDSDDGRMARQQTVLLALRDAIAADTILNAPALLDAARGLVWTDLPRESLPSLVELYGRASEAPVNGLRIAPPRYAPWLTAATIEGIRRDIGELVGVPRVAPVVPPGDAN